MVEQMQYKLLRLAMASVFLLSAVIPSSLAAVPMKSETGAHILAIAVADVVIDADKPAPTSKKATSDNPLSPPTEDKKDELSEEDKEKLEVELVKEHIKDLYGAVSAIVNEAAEIGDEDIQLLLLNAIIKFDEEKDVAADVKRVDLALGADLVYIPQSTAQYTGTVSDGSTADSSYSKGARLRFYQSAAVNTLNDAEGSDVELESLEDLYAQRDSLQALLTDVGDIIRTYIRSVRERMRTSTGRSHLTPRHKKKLKRYSEVLEKLDKAEVKTLLDVRSLLNFSNPNEGTLEGVKDTEENVIASVRMDMALAAIYTFLNPPKKTNPADRYLLYISKIDPRKQRQYIRALARIKKMNERAAKHEGLAIRVRGKVFPDGFPGLAVLLMGKNVLFELVQTKNNKSS